MFAFQTVITGPNSKPITTFLRLFEDFWRNYPLIPSIYLDTDNLAQRISYPVVLVLRLVENLSKILSYKKLTFGSYFLFNQSDMVSCPKPKLHG